MAKSSRHPGSLWEQHRTTILNYYASHCLTDVMAYMDEKHNFRASKMAFKKKLGRWSAPPKRRGPITKGICSSPAGIDSKRSTDLETLSPASAASTQDDGLPERSVTGTSYVHAPEIHLPVSELEPNTIKEDGNLVKFTKENVHELLKMTTQRHNSSQEHEIREGLDAAFYHSIATKDIKTAERILSAYVFFLGAESLHYLQKSQEFCHMVVTHLLPSREVAVRFQQTMSELQRVAANTSSDQLEQDAFVAVTLRLQNCLADDEFRCIISSLAVRNPATYSNHTFALGKVQLDLIKAYLKVTLDTWNSRTCKFETTYVCEGLQCLLYAAISQVTSQGGSQVGQRTDGILHDLMVILQELWKRQCSMQENWLWRPEAMDLVQRLDQALSLVHYQQSAYYRTICCVILMPWYQSQGYYDSVQTCQSRLVNMRSFTGFCYQDNINGLLRIQDQRSFEAAVALITKLA